GGGVAVMLVVDGVVWRGNGEKRDRDWWWGDVRVKPRWRRVAAGGVDEDRNDGCMFAAAMEMEKMAMMDFEVLDDDNHSTVPVQGNAPTTYAARSLALPRIYLEYDDPPQKKLRPSFSYN
nr:hypothetical protein [Tanacetum cinerariifolium]